MPLGFHSGGLRDGGRCWLYYKIRLNSGIQITSLRPLQQQQQQQQHSLSKMVLPHHTPYVTPHILHKHYAQAHDHDQFSQCMFFPFLFHFSLSHLPLVIGQDLEYFSQAGFDMDRIQIKRNAPVALLYEDAIRNEGAIISSSGALINFSGKKTGRCPKDKRIVYEETSKDEIWWGSVNIKMDERMFCIYVYFFFYPAYSH